MKRLITITITIASLVISFAFISCKKWVNDVDPLTNQIENEALDSEDQLDFLLTGLLGSFSNSSSSVEACIWDNAGFCDDFITDDLGFSPDFLNWCQNIPFDLAFADYRWPDFHISRYLADDLVARTLRLDAAGGISDDEVKGRCLWWGYLIGGLYRMYLGDMWGLDIDGSTPGGVITTIEQVEAGEFGEFQSTTELHALARERFTEALKYDPGDAIEGVGAGLGDAIVHSFIARTYLFDGDLAQAKTHAEQGLQQGDPPFQILHSAEHRNNFWYDSGRDYGLLSANIRFLHYVLDDRKEGEIVTALREEEDPLGLTQSLRGYEGEQGQPGHRRTENPRAGFANPNERLPLWEDWNHQGEGTEVGYQQDIYTDRDSPFNLIDWREMELILAECALQPSSGGDNAYSGDAAQALVHINNVRTYHQLDPYTLDDMMNYDNPDGGASTTWYTQRPVTNPVNITGPKGLLIEERDKTLWLKGTRHMDQRRFGLWHLPSTSTYWPYQPIPTTEISQNPNISR